MKAAAIEIKHCYRIAIIRVRGQFSILRVHLGIAALKAGFTLLPKGAVRSRMTAALENEFYDKQPRSKDLVK